MRSPTRKSLSLLPMLTGIILGSTQTHAATDDLDTHKDRKPQRQRKEEKREKDKTDEQITVMGNGFNTLKDPIGLSRMPQDALHTPQQINIVPQMLMKQQNVKSVDEALRNVPGVTSSIGEGAGGMNGDQFLIRGFQAQNDIYQDGLRDFGVYSRDAFNLETISVIKARHPRCSATAPRVAPSTW